MLKGIPPILSPQLLSVLCEMGHGEEILLADGNFPSGSYKKELTVIRCDGHGIPELLEAVLRLFPLDGYVQQPVTLMAVTPGDDYVPAVWDEYKKILAENGYGAERIQSLERFAFYERVKSASAVVATGEMTKYANILLKKGVITE